MKKSAFLICLFVLLSIPVFLYAEQVKNVSLQLSPETKLEIFNKTIEGFSAVSRISTIGLNDYQSPEGSFVKLEVEGYSKNFGSEGKPNLPVMTKLIEIPANASFQVIVKDYDVESISLETICSGKRIGPIQPSVSKKISSDMVEFIYDPVFYSRDEFDTPVPVTFEKIGSSRGVFFGKLKIIPFRYNPVQNQLQVLNNLSFEVLYSNDDGPTDENVKLKKYSAAFNRALEPVEKLPDNVSARKDALISGVNRPLTYVIVAHESFKGATSLLSFIDWKTQCGFTVIDAYTGDLEVGSTKESIKEYLETLYNSPDSPSYALFIGDIDKIPAWDGKVVRYGTHVTDLYYFTYDPPADGLVDFIPDVYYGRFPADNISDLDAIISKTLQYEKFEYTSDSASDYLDNYMFIAGDDNIGYASSHGNAQVNYAVSEYFPTIFKYLYTENRPSLANEIRYNFNMGMGFVNYTGHCDSFGWYNDTLENYYFTSDDLPNIKNKDKYGFVIGNCCESNKFDNDPGQNESDCFGEMILKQRDGGAIGYIGASNDTFWDEDFYWSVGKSSLSLSDNNVENHTSDNTQTGVYDGLFFTSDERELYATAGQIVYRGNLAVEETDSREAQYYWEVYNLMGDPSLAPYLSEPDSKNVQDSTPVPRKSEGSKNTCFIGIAWETF